jgi:succinoglycan biosynthesis protein ExoO
MVTVSIIVPCFNAEDYIADAVASLQDQTLSDWECIIIDDCSSDGSATLLRHLAERDERLRPHFLTVNGGASAARNAGLNAARGKWVTLLDADDLFEPSRLEKLVALAEKMQAEMVFDNQGIAEFPNNEPIETAFKWLTEDIQPFSRDTFFLESANVGDSLNPGYMKPLFSRKFIESNKLRYDPAFRSGQDFLLYAYAFAQNPICFATSHRGYIYRRRQGSLSRSGGQHLRNHARLSDEILARHGSMLPHSVHRALTRRKRYYENCAVVNDLRVALADGKWTYAARLSLTKPRLYLGIVSTIGRLLTRSR